MKTAIRGSALIIVFILTVLISTSLMKKGIIENELEVVVSDAIQQTQKVIQDERYIISSNEEYIAEFQQNMLRSISAIDEFVVDVYGIDYQKGLLDVEVSVTIKYPNGRTEKISTRKTNIVDKVET